MSSATPAAFWSAMSITTTSASCLSATPRATVAPTLPAPPTTVTLRFIRSPEPITKKVSCFSCFRGLHVGAARERLLHMIDDCVPELGRLQLFRAVHEPREVVG